MHRVVMDCPEGMCVDHINGDGLDNRRANLRVYTNGENLRNRRPRRGARYKGVWKRPGYDLWYAVLDRRRLGAFHSARDAAAAYNKAALEKYGPFARLNNLDD